MHPHLGLVKQLDMLRTINTRLTDQSDLWTYGSSLAEGATVGADPLADEMKNATNYNDGEISSSESIEFDCGESVAASSVVSLSTRRKCEQQADYTRNGFDVMHWLLVWPYRFTCKCTQKLETLYNNVM